MSSYWAEPLTYIATYGPSESQILPKPIDRAHSQQNRVPRLVGDDRSQWLQSHGQQCLPIGWSDPIQMSLGMSDAESSTTGSCHSSPPDSCPERAEHHYPMHHLSSSIVHEQSIYNYRPTHTAVLPNDLSQLASEAYLNESYCRWGDAQQPEQQSMRDSQWPAPAPRYHDNSQSLPCEYPSSLEYAAGSDEYSSFLPSMQQAVALASRRRQAWCEGAPPSRNDLPPVKQATKTHADLYHPMWVRGKGAYREGFCEQCHEEKRDAWHNLKTSAYWYDKTFVHGISSITGQMFCGPVEFRAVYRHERSGSRGQALSPRHGKMRQGLCGKCREWVPLGRMNRDAVRGDKYGVNWYKHAHKCQNTFMSEVSP